MTDVQPASQNNSSLSHDHSPSPQQPNPSSDQKLINIKIAAKKKKEIINLESSSQKNIDKSPIRVKGDEQSGSTPAKVIKPKKILPKCQLCKCTGKKVQMKGCSSCKHYFHITCLDENELKKKYVCDKCRAQQQFPQSKASKKSKKQEQKLEQQNNNSLPNLISSLIANNQPKLTQKKLEKQKRRDESNKTFLKFKQKYPYYISDNNKIKFPIQDKLLFIYRDYFEPNENARIIFGPPNDHPIIPSKYLGDFLELENFIVSFQNEFGKDYCGQYKKSILYLTMNCNGTDKVFEQLLGTIIKIYMKDIYLKNKTENVKILNDHCFFILLGTFNESESAPSQLIAMISRQIIRHLSNVPSMKQAFKRFQFPERLNLQSKLYVLIQMIQGLSQVDGFHEMVSRKSEKISELTKDKAEYVSKLKQNQAQALSNKEKLKQIQGKIDEVGIPGEPEQDIQNRKKNNQKQIEKNKKKTNKLSMQHQNSSKLIKQYKQKIVQITKTIPFTISEVMFLGSDRNKSHYYFYLREPNRLYVRYKHYLLDASEQYKIYEGKQKIAEYMKTLNNKGLAEKHLLQNLTFLMKEQIIRNLTEFQIQKQMESQKMDTEDYKGSFIQTQEEYRKKIIDDVMEMQQKFSNYLVIKSCRWASQSKREQFKFGFPYIDNIQSMKQAIRTLQQSFLFVEIVREQEQRNQSDSNQEQNGQQQRQIYRRRKPIRIWGINSERIKKFWLQYLELCIDYTGIWIIVSIFKNFVDKYLQKKLQSIREQQRRQNLQRQKQTKRRLRQARERQSQQKKQKQFKQKSRITRSMNDQPQMEEQEEDADAAPHRNLRSNNRSNIQYPRRKPLMIDSDQDNEYGNQKQDMQNNQEEEEDDFINEDQDQDDSSNNEDECGICKEVGDVICCDTCPKVYHLECLKLKEVPEGDWSCMECLQKMANTRQTRSRARLYKKQG